jgi:hypothetical protein
MQMEIDVGKEKTPKNPKQKKSVYYNKIISTRGVSLSIDK